MFSQIEVLEEVGVLARRSALLCVMPYFSRSVYGYVGERILSAALGYWSVRSAAEEGVCVECLLWLVSWLRLLRRGLSGEGVWLLVVVHLLNLRRRRVLLSRLHACKHAMSLRWLLRVERWLLLLLMRRLLRWMESVGRKARHVMALLLIEVCRLLQMSCIWIGWHEGISLL